jgi:hypothetical protein
MAPWDVLSLLSLKFEVWTRHTSRFTRNHGQIVRLLRNLKRVGNGVTTVHDGILVFGV